MQIKVIKQDEKIFEGKAQKVYARTEEGDVEILDQHAKFIGILSGRKIKLDESMEIDIGNSKALLFTDGNEVYIFVE